MLAQPRSDCFPGTPPVVAAGRRARPRSLYRSLSCLSYNTPFSSRKLMPNPPWAHYNRGGTTRLAFRRLLQLPPFFTSCSRVPSVGSGHPGQLLHASHRARRLRSQSLISCHDECSRTAMTSPQSAQQCVTFIRVSPIKNIIPGALTLDWGAGTNSGIRSDSKRQACHLAAMAGLRKNLGAHFQIRMPIDCV